MTRMTPSEAFVETLAAQGVTHVFGIVGSAYMDALDIFEPAGIRFVSVTHEQNAAHMADGYARAGDRHGVCIAQNGPGVTNFVTANAAAYGAHSPVVAITPETGSGTMGAEGVTVDHPDQVGDALRQAVASDRTTIVEVMVTQELGDPFRRDALKKPVRLLDKDRDYTVT